jgi:hypothetical protein
MPKPKKPIREMHRWEKMMAGATDMEELLVQAKELLSRFTFFDQECAEFVDKIKAQLKRTGRLK